MKSIFSKTPVLGDKVFNISMAEVSTLNDSKSEISGSKQLFTFNSELGKVVLLVPAKEFLMLNICGKFKHAPGVLCNSETYDIVNK